MRTKPRERAEQAAREKAAARGEDEDTTAQRVADAAAAAVPKPKAQRNFTDPESKIMKTSDGAFHQCFNGQAVVDEGHQVIVAAQVSDCAADVANLIPMTEQTTVNTGQVPGEVLADAGYCSAENLAQAATVSAACGTEFFIATGRSTHDAPIPVSPRGRIRKDATPRERMARKLTTTKGRAAYARRKVIVEPVFGQMATLQNATQLLLRGLDGARGEWLLLAACHNLRKLHGHIGVAGLTGLALA
ncbi:MAG TPA: transposase [Intrasporangium sp.]|uniref:transposase n=1 Tax=Intrasporangium sp. TaxID=1925024 RepID=UPI002D76BA45|nr:transposase [Intrasporangium sp.]HET7398753.1 transposase [Intrasporangium sp.]